MNDQPSPSCASELDAYSGEPDQPFPTIEPEMVELLADIDNPVIDPPPLEIAAVNDGAAMIPDSPAQAPAQLDAPPVEGEMAAYIGRPISSVMDRTLWTVHAEDSIEKVEGILAEQHLSSAPVVGSNGAIIGMISHLELAQFHAEGRNAKAAQAWEIARIKTFEVFAGDNVEDVAKLMAENKIEHISVTESGRLIGIVSAQELLLDMLNVLPDTSTK